MTVVQPMQEHRAPAGQQTPSQRLLKAAFVALATIAALEELAYLRHRAKRSMANWWARVEHRQRSQVEGAELAFLAKRLIRR